MNATRDDDALSWAGDDDPTLTPSERDTEKLPEGWSIPAPPKRDQTTGSALDADSNADSEAAASVSSLALVSMGVLGGIYLLYTIGWFISTGRIGNPLADPVGQFMFSLGA